MQRARERGSDIVGAYQKRREFERDVSSRGARATQ